MKIARGPILPIFGLDKLTWIFSPAGSLFWLPLLFSLFELSLITTLGKLRHCDVKGRLRDIDAFEYCVEDTNNKSVKKQMIR